MKQIPSVDLRDFLSASPERKQKFVNEIGKAYQEIGFVALKGHFLEEELVDELYREVKNFFELPVETKKKYEIAGPERILAFRPVSGRRFEICAGIS